MPFHYTGGHDVSIAGADGTHTLNTSAAALPGNTDCALQVPFNLPGGHGVPLTGVDGRHALHATAAAVPASDSHFRTDGSVSFPGVPLVLEAGGEGVGPEEQMRALGAIIDRHISQANTSVRGVCLSSFLISGCQAFRTAAPAIGGSAMPNVPTVLPVPGLSLGEPCLGWERTQEAVRLLAEAVRAGRRARERASATGGGTEGGKRQKTG